MKKTGILTYHYSNNYGGVLQSYALNKYLISKGIDAEIINYVPSNYKNSGILRSTGLRKNIFKSNLEDINPVNLFKRIKVKILNNKRIVERFDNFRDKYMSLSSRVDEHSISEILKDYEVIIVGSDQIWTPKQRNKREYFLDFGHDFQGKKISYAADSTISEIEPNQIEELRNALKDFKFISVRNEHSNKFVHNLIGENVPIVVDPTLLSDFDDLLISNNVTSYTDEKYILVYSLGKEIPGTNKKAIKKIKEIYGDLKVYSVMISTTKFNLCSYADEVLYDLGPLEWLNMFKNATFVLTDSYHGTLFSIKFRKPFLAYYAEEMRATRFKDIAKRYGINKYIIKSVDEIDEKNCFNNTPDFERINDLITSHKSESINFLEEVLDEN